MMTFKRLGAALLAISSMLNRDDMCPQLRTTLPTSPFGNIPLNLLRSAVSQTSPPALTDPHQTQDTSISNSHTQLTLQSDYPSYPQDIGQEPSLSFSRATWWDYLLQTYTFRTTYPGSSVIARSHEDSAREITQDVRRFFQVASIYLHFINVPLFFDMFHHKSLRASIQPAFILSILAYSKLLEHYLHVMGSGQDDEEGERIWIQSIALKDLAQAAFEASYNAGWVNLHLAQAAWVRSALSHPGALTKSKICERSSFYTRSADIGSRLPLERNPR